MIAISVYYPEFGMTLAAIALKIVENKAVILLQDRIYIAELIDGSYWLSGTYSPPSSDLRHYNKLYRLRRILGRVIFD